MKKTLMLAALLAAAPAGVLADSSGWEYPRETQLKNGKMLVDVGDIDMEGKPNCANDGRWEFVVTDPGQQQLIKEYAMRGWSVYWQGTGQCDGNAETVKSVYTCFDC
jgi:hypothetical protein